VTAVTLRFDKYVTPAVRTGIGKKMKKTIENKQKQKPPIDNSGPFRDGRDTKNQIWLSSLLPQAFQKTFVSFLLSVISSVAMGYQATPHAHFRNLLSVIGLQQLFSIGRE